jgi:hypothetical protein
LELNYKHLSAKPFFFFFYETQILFREASTRDQTNFFFLICLKVKHIDIAGHTIRELS